MGTEREVTYGVDTKELAAFVQHAAENPDREPDGSGEAASLDFTGLSTEYRDGGIS